MENRVRAKRMKTSNDDYRSRDYNRDYSNRNYSPNRSSHSGKKRRRKNSKKQFITFLKRYVCVLLVLMVIFLIYVVKSLNTYEDLQIENFISKAIEENIDKYVSEDDIKVSKFETEKVDKKKMVRELFKNGTVSYKLNSESLDLTNPVYDVYINGNAAFKVSLNGEKKLTKLAILTIQDWKVEKIEFLGNAGLYECTISAPNNYKVYVNNIQVTDEEKTEGEQDEGLQQLAEYTEIPYVVKYTISGLVKEPKIKIEDENGKEVEYKKNENNFEVELNFEDVEDEDTALGKINGNINILDFAEDWSLYLSDDLSGRFNGIKKYLIEDSYMWDYAKKWASSVDITFISKHTFSSPRFTNEKVSNFKIYSKNAFSCDVYLEKNMIVRGNKLVDKLSERMYFAYYKGEWKLVNMQSTKK